MNVKKISILLIVGVILIVLIYAIVLLALTWPVSELSINKSAVFSDSFGLLTSVFSGLAFAGLIITIMLQKDELVLQRKELELQRKSLESQVEELKSMSNFAALNQLKSMINAALIRLSENDGEPSKPEHFYSSMMPGTEWKILLESTNPEEVMQAYQVYSKKNAPAEIFVSSFVSAAKFYFRSIGNEDINYNLSYNEFVVINNSWLKEVPYLSSHLRPVVHYAKIMIAYEPAHKMFLLAGLIATQKLTGNEAIIKEEAIDELIEYLSQRGKDLPAIAKT